ncbi:MAG: hypothetical protein ACLPVY_27685 [Acidimicrobiia bacterium]
MALHRHHRDDGTFQGPIISGAPFRGATVGAAGHVDVDDADAEHRNDEHVVTLTRVPTSFGARVVVAALESRGIKAGVVGRRVVVFERDLATARAIIAETNDDEAADDDQLETDDDKAADDDRPDLGRQ